MPRKKRKLSERLQVPFRIFEEEYQKLILRTTQDKVTVQKFFEVMYRAYLDDNPEVQKLISKHTGEKRENKKLQTLTQIEADQLLREIEENSPLKLIEKAKEEVNKIDIAKYIYSQNRQ